MEMIYLLLVVLLIIVVLGFPLYFMFKHIMNVMKRNYIFDIKFMKLRGNKIQFKKDYKRHSLPIVRLNFYGKTLNFLIDTGADVNVMNIKALMELPVSIPMKPAGNVTTGGGEVNAFNASMKFSYEKDFFDEEFSLLDMDAPFANVFNDNGIMLHGVLGSKFFNKYRWVIDFENMVIWTK